jgi:hypothetical protein
LLLFEILQESPNKGFGIFENPQTDSYNDLWNADPGNGLKVFELTKTLRALCIVKIRKPSKRVFKPMKNVIENLSKISLNDQFRKVR